MCIFIDEGENDDWIGWMKTIMIIIVPSFSIARIYKFYFVVLEY